MSDHASCGQQASGSPSEAASRQWPSSPWKAALITEASLTMIDEGQLHLSLIADDVQRDAPGEHRPGVSGNVRTGASPAPGQPEPRSPPSEFLSRRHRLNDLVRLPVRFDKASYTGDRTIDGFNSHRYGEIAQRQPLSNSTRSIWDSLARSMAGPGSGDKGGFLGQRTSTSSVVRLIPIAVVAPDLLQTRYRPAGYRLGESSRGSGDRGKALHAHPRFCSRGYGGSRAWGAHTQDPHEERYAPVGQKTRRVVRIGAGNSLNRSRDVTYSLMTSS